MARHRLVPVWDIVCDDLLVETDLGLQPVVVVKKWPHLGSIDEELAVFSAPMNLLTRSSQRIMSCVIPLRRAPCQICTFVS
jgi:hypothetical protein